MSLDRAAAGRRSRCWSTVLIVALGLGVGGIALLHSTAPFGPSRPASRRPPRPPPPPSRRSESLTDEAIYARVEPSVVDVTATLRYDDETASGTGFFIDSRDGLVLTNNHVIRDATSVTVTIPATNQTYQAQIVGADLSADIAVLRITPLRRTVSAPIGDSATVAVGSPSSPSATGRARAARRCPRPASSAPPAGRSRRPTAPPGSPRRSTACCRPRPRSSPATPAARWPTPPGR